MARDYQRTKNNKYILPRAVYHQTIWRIRDYYRLKCEADYLLSTSAVNTENESVQNSQISDPVATKAIRREKLLEDVCTVDRALKEIPPEYRKGVWENIMFGKAYPLDADRSTYGRYKSRFVYILAERFGIF